MACAYLHHCATRLERFGVGTYVAVKLGQHYARPIVVVGYVLWSGARLFKMNIQIQARGMAREIIMRNA